MTIEWKCSFSAINAINLVVLILFTSLLWKPLSAAKYEPNWKSLDTRPLPNWYDQAKVGIFIHWGVYSVPSFGSEWFWINWNKKNPDYVNYMNKNYKPGFTYQEFGRDFAAEHFNAHEWTELFKQSGARYVVLTSKHHDGFTMWPSKYSFSWNSVDVGPHRDVVGELSMAIAANSSLKFGLYHSLYEWFNPMYMGDKMKLYMTDEFVDKKIWPEMMELVNRYHPQVLWSDGDWEAPDKYWKSTDFIAWLYNDSPVRDTIVTNDRWGIGVTCKHGDFYTCSDRYNPGILQPHKWENAMTLDKKSWGHRSNARLEDYMTSDDLIRELVSTVSCGGNLLINVGPTKEGLIEPIFAERLKDMGSWLKINGEAIYNTIPWTFQNDTKTPNVWYTNAPIKNSKRSTVYAIVLDYPYDAGGVNLFSLGRLYDNDTKVIMLGTNKPLKWYGSAEALYVTFPKKREIDKLGLKFAWTLKFDMPIKNLKDNRIPEILDMSNN